MASKKQPSRRIIVILTIVAIVVPFFFFSIAKSPWKGTSFVARVFQEIIYPFEYAWDKSATGVASFWNNYVWLVNTAQVNRQLHSENEALKTKLLDYDEQIQEIFRLRNLLEFSQRFRTEMVVAEVVGAPRSHAFLSIRVAKGELDQVQPGMPVVSALGIVGRVVRVGLKFSDIQLLTDSNFYMDVLLQRTRVRGVINGLADGRATLSLSRRAEVRIGDTVVSSGIISGIPKGLPVGKVVRISYEADNITQNVTVMPWVDYRTLEEVVILKQTDATLEKIVETAGNEWINEAVESIGGG